MQKASVQSTYSTLTVFAGPWQSTVYCLEPSMLCWVSVLHRLLTDWQWQCNERLFISIAVQLAWSIHTTAPTQCIQIKLTPLMLWRVWTPGWNMAAKITGCPRLVTQHCWWRWWTCYTLLLLPFCQWIQWQATLVFSARDQPFSIIKVWCSAG